jgi:DNA-binding response OmpR family regulator
MIFLGRGFYNHLIPAPAASEGESNAFVREQFCHLAAVRAVYRRFRGNNGCKTTRGGAESMALIYIVEDDEPIRRELADILVRAGFEVEACELFEHVSRDILAAAPDLVLLDLTLPVKDGQHICHEVRRESEVPIIVLTSRTTEIDEVMAMTLGADDFISKPYSARVLVARINALLRRTTSAGERSTMVHKGLELDLARSTVTNTTTGDSTELTKNELRILSLLLGRAGKIVSRSAIMQDLWDSDAFVDDNTLTVNINRLRATLDKIGIKGYLTTHRGQGYSV